jgi:hypothetical protein
VNLKREPPGIESATTVEIVVGAGSASDTATPEADFVGPRRVTFAAGESTKRIAFTLVEDRVVEPSEKFTVEIASVVDANGDRTRASIGTPREAVCVIADGVSVTFNRESVEVSANGAASVELVLSHALSAPLTVQVTVVQDATIARAAARRQRRETLFEVVFAAGKTVAVLHFDLDPSAGAFELRATADETAVAVGAQSVTVEMQPSSAAGSESTSGGGRGRSRSRAWKVAAIAVGCAAALALLVLVTWLSIPRFRWRATGSRARGSSSSGVSSSSSVSSSGSGNRSSGSSSGSSSSSGSGSSSSSSWSSDSPDDAYTSRSEWHSPNSGWSSAEASSSTHYRRHQSIAE